MMRNNCWVWFAGVSGGRKKVLVVVGTKRVEGGDYCSRFVPDISSLPSVVVPLHVVTILPSRFFIDR